MEVCLEDLHRSFFANVLSLSWFFGNLSHVSPFIANFDRLPFDSRIQDC